MWSLYGGAISEWMSMGVIGRLVMPILTTGFAIRPEVVSWAMTLPRMLDAVLDPFVGHLSDRTQSRWGRRRPFAFIGALLCAAMAMAIWWISPKWSEAVQFGYLLTVGTVFWVGFALFSISIYAMNYELVDGCSYQHRVRFFAIRSLFCQVAVLAAGGWAYWLVLRPMFGGEIAGIRWVSIILASLILLGGWAPALLFKERFAARAKEATSHSLWQGMREAWRIQPMRQLIIIRLLLGFGFAIFNGLYLYVNIYHACGGDKMLATKIAGLTEIANVALNVLQVPLVAPLARRMGRRSLLLVGIGAHLGLAATGFLFFTPDMPYLQIASTLFWAPAGFVFGTVCASAIPDICDLDELQNGTRREGLFGAAIVFLNKMEVALCTLIPGYVLVFSGFVGDAVKQSEHTLFWLRVCSYTPYVLVGIIAILIALRYPLTEQVMAKVRADLAQRRNGGTAT